MFPRGNNLIILLFTLMSNVLAQDVPTERFISLKFRATHEASLRDAIQNQDSILNCLPSRSRYGRLRHSFSDGARSKAGKSERR